MSILDLMFALVVIAGMSVLDRFDKFTNPSEASMPKTRQVKAISGVFLVITMLIGLLVASEAVETDSLGLFEPEIIYKMLFSFVALIVSGLLYIYFLRYSLITAAISKAMFFMFVLVIVLGFSVMFDNYYLYRTLVNECEHGSNEYIFTLDDAEYTKSEVCNPQWLYSNNFSDVKIATILESMDAKCGECEKSIEYENFFKYLEKNK